MRGHISVMTFNFHCQRERSGKIKVRNMPLFIFLFFKILYFHFFDVMPRCEKITCPDIWPSLPTGASPIERRGTVSDMEIRCIEVDEMLKDIEENLQCLTMGILDISTDDLPR